MTDVLRTNGRTRSHLAVRVDCIWRLAPWVDQNMVEDLRVALENEAVRFFEQAAEGIYHSGLDEIAVSSEEIPMLERKEPTDV